MTARLTAAEARALGITVPGTKTRTTRKTGAGPYRTRCKCGEEFTTAASEDRHVSMGHNRFILIDPGVHDEVR